MLGLTVHSVSVSDVDIVQRLEKLILSSQSCRAGTFVINAADVNGAAVDGLSYRGEYAGLDLGPPLPTPRPGHRKGDRSSDELAPRSRSLSPMKRDSNVY